MESYSAGQAHGFIVRGNVSDRKAEPLLVGWAMEIPLRAAGEPLSVLLVEDEILISLDLCETLVKGGYQVLGPAHTLAGALFLLQHQTPHYAIVDVLLRDGPCTEVARLLRARGVPFVIHSGYGRHAAAIEGFAGTPFLDKPASPGDVVKLLGGLTAPDRKTAMLQ